jgi:hypothetical protein
MLNLRWWRNPRLEPPVAALGQNPPATEPASSAAVDTTPAPHVEPEPANIHLEVPLRVGTQAAAQLLRDNKALVVRGAIDAAVVRRYGCALRDRLDTYKAQLEAIRDNAKARRFMNEHFRQVHEAAGLEPYALIKTLSRSPALDVMRSYFGLRNLPSTWTHLVSGIAMRTSEGARDALPFHQDGGMYGGYFVRAWILIYPESAGDLAAGVQFLPERSAAKMHPIEKEAPVSPTYGFLETSHQHIRSVESEQRPWTPVVRVGDIVLFTGDCLHATYIPPTVASDRIAIQATFFAGDPDVDFCVFTPDGVQFPTDGIVESWYDKTLPKSPVLPAQTPGPRHGFDLIA